MPKNNAAEANRILTDAENDRLDALDAARDRERENDALTSPHVLYVELRDEDDGIHIAPIWTGVDRPDIGGYLVGRHQRALAERMRDAIMAGVVFYDVYRATDVNGKTYAAHRSHVLARMMNADLKRLGF